MKEIPLTQGKFAKVDDDDYDILAQHKWCLSHGYAVHRINGVASSMHREIICSPPGFEIDHINMDKLDNRKCNLRVCSTQENQRNRGKQSNNTSGYKGVCWHKPTSKWGVSITARGRQLHLGLFVLPEEAARAYDSAARKYHGEFAYFNFPAEAAGK